MIKKKGNHVDCIASTDLKNIFTHKYDPNIVNNNFSDARENFHGLFDNAFLSRNEYFGGLFRLHIELPWVKSKNEISIPKNSLTQLQSDTTDIISIIYRKNVSTFFQ